MNVMHPLTEVDRLASRSVPKLVEAILLFARAVVQMQGYDEALRRIGDLIAGSAGVAYLLGRKRVWREVDQRRRYHRERAAYGMAAPITSEGLAWVYASIGAYDSVYTQPSNQEVIPGVPFAEAIDELLKREPRIAPGYRAVQKLYTTEHGFALAKQFADPAITEKVQETIRHAMQFGTESPKAQEVIQQIGDWAHSYAETVFRTNVTTSYADGRMEQARDEELRDIIVGLRRVAVLDADTRANHAAAHDLVAAQDDPIWTYLGVPGGYNCRCSYELVDIYEAEASGLMVNGKMRTATPPAGAYNDPGFEKRGPNPFTIAASA